MVAYLTDEVLGRAQPFDKEYRIARADTGETRWVHGRGALELDPSGRPIRMLGTIADVTEQHRAQEALTASELRYAAILDGAIEAIFVAETASLRIRWVNPAACALLGYTSDELLRMTVHDIHPPADLPTALEQFAAQARGRISLAKSVPCRRKDGSTILADVKELSALVDGVACNIGFFTDVTERVAAEAERNRLAAALEQTSDSVVITDLAGTIEYANPAFESISGYRRDGVIGQNPRLLKSGQQSAAFYRALWSRLTRGKSWTGRFINRRADGMFYQVEATISPIRIRMGRSAATSASSGTSRRCRQHGPASPASFVNGPRWRRPSPACSPARAAETAATSATSSSGCPASTSRRSSPSMTPSMPSRSPRPAPRIRRWRLAAAARCPRRISTRAGGAGSLGRSVAHTTEDGQYGRDMAGLGLRASAFAPIRNGDGLLGLVAAGTTDEAYARHLIDHLPVVGEFAATASALLARDLEGDRGARGGMPRSPRSSPRSRSPRCSSRSST